MIGIENGLFSVFQFGGTQIHLDSFSPAILDLNLNCVPNQARHNESRVQNRIPQMGSCIVDSLLFGREFADRR